MYEKRLISQPVNFIYKKTEHVTYQSLFSDNFWKLDIVCWCLSPGLDTCTHLTREVKGTLVQQLQERGRRWLFGRVGDEGGGNGGHNTNIEFTCIHRHQCTCAPFHTHTHFCKVMRRACGFLRISYLRSFIYMRKGNNYGFTYGRSS